jgi:drug/metabolite transporter (DMT)-like permease
MLTYVLAVLAACANATSSVLQRKANRQVPRPQHLNLKLIWNLAHEPVWFGGILAVIVGFLLQATALSNGELSVVEPILVLELPATLVLASRVFRPRLHRREWGSAAAMTAALAGLLYFLSPSAGRNENIPWYAWVTGIGINLAFVAFMVAWASHGPSGRGRADGQNNAWQAALLAVAAGSAFGLTAALIKGMTNAYARGFGALFASWQLYGMVVTGAVAMFLVQAAMNAGRLIAAQPGLTLSDPIVSILWGVLVFGERVRSGWFIALAVISGLVMAGAVVVLARSPLLSGESAQREEEDSPGDGAANGNGPSGAGAGHGKPAADGHRRNSESRNGRGQRKPARGALRGEEQ